MGSGYGWLVWFPPTYQDSRGIRFGFTQQLPPPHKNRAPYKASPPSLCWLFRRLRIFTTESIASIALQQVIRFCDILRIPLGVGVSEAGPAIAYIGLHGPFPAPGNDMAPKIPLSPSTATKWAVFIAPNLRGRSISHAGLDALIGRLNFAQSTTFNRFSLGMLNPLYEMMYGLPFCTALSPIARRILRRRYATFVSPRPAP